MRKRRRRKPQSTDRSRRELKQKYQGYEVKQDNIHNGRIMEMVPRLRSRHKELVGSKNKGVLHNMQKVVISGTLNIFGRVHP